MLCRHDAARQRLVLTGAARRRIFGEYQASQPSRFIEEIPSDLGGADCELFVFLSGEFPHYEFRTNPYGRAADVHEKSCRHMLTSTRPVYGHGPQARHTRTPPPVRRRQCREHRAAQR